MLKPAITVSRHLWNWSAALLIALALVAATCRVLLLEIDRHSGWVESWLTRTLERPVTIGELEGHWRGWSPSIRINSLTIHERDNTNSLVQFDSAVVELSISESIKRKDLIPNRITLGGVRFSLERAANGEIAIAGMPPSRWPVAQWIEGQQQFNLRDADIEFIDNANGGIVHHFVGLALSIRREGALRTISGRVSREATTTENWEFRINANESVISSDWDGKITLIGENIQIPISASDELTRAFGLVDQALTVSIDSDWTNAKLRHASFLAKALAAIPPDNVSVTNSHDENSTHVLKGNAERIDNGWALGVNVLKSQFGLFSTVNPPTVRVRWHSDHADLVWSIANLPIEAVFPQLVNALQSQHDLPEHFHQLSPSGIITNGTFLSKREQPARPIAGNVNLESLSWQAVDEIPGINAIDANIEFNSHSGLVNFPRQNQTQVISEKWLANVVNFSNLNGTIHWLVSDNGVTLRTHDLATNIESVDLLTSGSIQIDQHDTKLNLFSKIKAGELSRLKYLVPKNVLPAKGERWARNAFLSGNINHGGMILRGPLSKFPFDEQEGIFQVHIDASGADVKYGAKWPMANNVGGRLTIENRGVDFAVTSGRMYSSDVSNSKIRVEDLFTKTRYVQVSGKTTVVAQEVTKFIEQSPLLNTKAKRFKELDIGAPFELELDLNLGIFPGGEKDVLGQTYFRGNRIESKKLKLALDNVVGDVSFTRHDWYGEGLSATFKNNRVGVLLNGGLDDPNYDTEIRLTGTSEVDFILDQIETYAPRFSSVLKGGAKTPVVSGKTAWKAVISLPEAKSSGQPAPKKLNIESSLAGLAIDLPWPLSKGREQSIPLSITVTTPQNGHRDTIIRFGDRLNAIFSDSALQDDNKRRFLGADLVFDDASSQPTRRDELISLRGKIARLNPDAWRTTLKPMAEGATAQENAMPMALDLNVGALDIFGNTYASTKISGTKSNEGWLVTLQGDGLAGEVTAPHDETLPIKLKFSRLHLSKRTPSRPTKIIDPRQLRPFTLESLSTHYDEINLGKVSVTTERSAEGIRIVEVFSEQGDVELRGEGNWELKDGAHESRMNVTVQGESLAGLFEGFGYEIANIEGGATNLELDSRWDGTPFDFSLAKLRGHLALNVESGRFLDIEPGGGRLFGLLSLQTLPRRLSLDFKDLFSKGFTFDTIAGNFSIDQGNAYTNSLMMDGPSARILISGRTGLKEQDYDQRVTVTPALSNSIPVASALFGPAGIGVGAVIYLGQKMFKSIPEQMDKILSREYSITGDWSSPVIEKNLISLSLSIAPAPFKYVSTLREHANRTPSAV